MNTDYASPQDRRAFCAGIAENLRTALTAQFPGIKFSVRVCVAGTPVKKIGKGSVSYWYSDTVTATFKGARDKFDPVYAVAKTFGVPDRAIVKVNAFD